MTITKNANSHPIKATLVKDEGVYANSHPYKVALEGGEGGEIATKADIEELNAKLEALATDLTYKGKVAGEEDLPSSGNVEGDVYLTEDTGLLYVWADSGWVALNESGGIPTDATFWGASYDATNNTVDGAINSTTAGPAGSNYDIFSYHPSNGTLGLELTLNNYTYDTGSKTISMAMPYRNKSTGAWLGKILAYINWNSQQSSLKYDVRNAQIKLLKDPTDAQDAATKNYVDNLVGDIESALDLINNGSEVES